MSSIDVDAAARRVLDEAGYGDWYLHGTGHGVGLDIHELPMLGRTSPDRVVPGNVVTIEPGLYREGFGGFRIDDLVVVEHGGEVHRGGLLGLVVFGGLRRGCPEGLREGIAQKARRSRLGRARRPRGATAGRGQFAAVGVGVEEPPHPKQIAAQVEALVREHRVDDHLADAAPEELP